MSSGSDRFNFEEQAAGGGGGSFSPPITPPVTGTPGPDEYLQSDGMGNVAWAAKPSPGTTIPSGTGYVKQGPAGTFSSGSIAANDLPIVPEAKGGFGADVSAVSPGLLHKTGTNTTTSIPLPGIVDQFLAGDGTWVYPPSGGVGAGSYSQTILYPSNSASSDVVGAKKLLMDPETATAVVVYPGVTTTYSTLVTYITEPGEPGAEIIDTGIVQRHFTAWISSGGSSVTARLRVSMYYVDADGVSNSTLIRQGESPIFSHVGESEVIWSYVATQKYDSTSMPPFNGTKRIKFVIEAKRANAGAAIDLSIRYGGPASSYIVTTIPSDKEGCNGGQSGLASGIDILTTAGTYYPILSPLFVPGPSYGFDSTVPNTLTRKCPGTTRTVHLIAFVSGFVGNASDAYRIAWRVNGTVIGSPAYVQAAGSFISASIILAADSNQGDSFDLAITNATGHNGDTFVCMSYSTTVHMVKTA